jgi:UDP-glucose 4-epimerase
MVPSIDRVYVNERARNELGWQPGYDLRYLIYCLRSGQDIKSPLARQVGSKGYHADNGRTYDGMQIEGLLLDSGPSGLAGC